MKANMGVAKRVKHMSKDEVKSLIEFIQFAVQETIKEHFDQEEKQIISDGLLVEIVDIGIDISFPDGVAT